MKNGTITTWLLGALLAVILSMTSMIMYFASSNATKVEHRMDGIERRLETLDAKVSLIQSQYGQITTIQRDMESLKALIIELLRKSGS